MSQLPDGTLPELVTARPTQGVGCLHTVQGLGELLKKVIMA